MALRSGRLGQVSASAKDANSAAHKPRPPSKITVFVTKRTKKEPEERVGVDLGEVLEELIGCDFKLNRFRTGYYART